MLPEYGNNNPEQRRNLLEHMFRRQTLYGRLKYVDTVYSGFKKDSDEMGILLSNSLVHPAPAHIFVHQLDEKIRTPLLGASALVDYQDTTELSMQYSHDTYESALIAGQTPVAHFLNVHREFCKTSYKSQDVVMVGNNEQPKVAALSTIKEKLISDGYTKISFYNTENKKETVLYEAQSSGKNFRVIYASGMTHISMLACYALSGPLSGATGDQSLGEALSGDKLMVYECLPVKRQLSLPVRIAS